MYHLKISCLKVSIYPESSFLCISDIIDKEIEMGEMNTIINIKNNNFRFQHQFENQ